MRKPPQKQASKAKRYPVIPVEFKQAEKDAIAEKAKRKGLGTSTFIKELIFTHPDGVPRGGGEKKE